MSDPVMLAQLAGTAVLGTVLLVVWGDLGNLAFVRRLPGGARFLIGLAAIAGMIGTLVAPTYRVPARLSEFDAGPTGNGAAAAKRPLLNLDWPLTTVADRTPVNLQSLKGKVLFINIWATWCGPCVGELPSIDRLYEKFAGRDDVAFLLISQDDNIAKAAQFAESHKMKAPVYHSRTVPPQFQTEGIPVTVIVRKDGTMQFADVGAREWDSANWVKEIEDLSRLPTSDAPAKESPAKESKP